MVRPRQAALGLTIADVIIAMHLARAHKARLTLVPASPFRVSPLLQLEADGVVRNRIRSLTAPLLSWTFAVIRMPAAAARGIVAATYWVLDTAQERVRHWGDVVTRRQTTRPDKERWAYRTQGWMAVFDRLKPSRRPPTDLHRGLDLRKHAALEPLNVRLPAALEHEARDAARRIGIAPGARLVTLHTREGSSKPAAGSVDRDRDTVRNVRTDTYRPAAELLLSRGYTVVRIGDPSLSPFDSAGAIDLARHPERTSLLELWCLTQSAFFIACDSGPYLLSWMLDRPCLAVNIVNVLGVYPLRTRDRYLVKRLEHVASGRQLPLDEMLTPDVIYNVKRDVIKRGTLKYVDNAPAEIRDAVAEMIDIVEGSGAAATADQLRVRELVRQTRDAGNTSKLVDKTGLTEVFLGDGYIGRAFAATHLSAGAPAHSG